MKQGGGGGNGNNLSWEFRFEPERLSGYQLISGYAVNCISLLWGRNGNNLSWKLRFEADGRLSGSHLLSRKSRRAVGVLTGPPLLLFLFAFYLYLYIFDASAKFKSCEFSFGLDLLRCQGWVFCAFLCLPKLDLFPLKLNCLNIHSFWLGGCCLAWECL